MLPCRTCTHPCSVTGGGGATSLFPEAIARHGECRLAYAAIYHSDHVAIYHSAHVAKSQGGLRCLSAVYLELSCNVHISTFGLQTGTKCYYYYYYHSNLLQSEKSLATKKCTVLPYFSSEKYAPSTPEFFRIHIVVLRALFEMY